MRKPDEVFEEAPIAGDPFVIRLNWDRIALVICLGIIMLLLGDKVLNLRNGTSGQQGTTSITLIAEPKPGSGSMASALPSFAIQAVDAQAAEAAPTEVDTEAAHHPVPESRPMLNVEDIVALRRQGLQLLANGDSVAGRMALKRAAEAGDATARAALAEDDAASEQALYEKATRLTRETTPRH
jgi:hypothetical protein